ncbi:hypothetical protein K9857_19000 [Pseudomonas sp. REP124]|nr:hypothetical protein [Pseudomonas sp. REP124]
MHRGSAPFVVKHVPFE